MVAEVPVTEPVTEPPPTEPTVTEATITEAPTTETPTTQPTTTQAPTTQAPATTETPTEAPTEAPVTQPPVTEEPTADPINVAHEAEKAELERLKELEQQELKDLRPLQKTSQIWRWIDDMLDEKFVERLVLTLHDEQSALLLLVSARMAYQKSQNNEELTNFNQLAKEVATYVEGNFHSIHYTLTLVNFRRTRYWKTTRCKEPADYESAFRCCPFCSPVAFGASLGSTLLR